ncbi:MULTISPECIES: type III secretion system YopJ family effector AvrBsT [Xanthomonas]|uniref:AvrBsT n=2 Tax=Xanthomonas TaxID=338 RepID=A0A7Z7J691_XANCH|nr:MULTISPECIES: type III secretion system YopJ family effector AvrBsT [Xanthomonas]ATB60836.1 YopJ Serine/Threonine acetyltransferase [Xanthomonas citri pv. fuscans]ATS40959.1 type III secretion system YopJ family effector AvrBsT [Xanthomonas citri pv. phaseoli var. fuscans]ATS45181.1 type III secretion system YopJ family effector AvrBsT [Xanthomonas citri pv. phaseoli var. fuscans]ATS49463.1 type III secretion system YopJ family effector AvrBsT [Xanthomonas citri pv. phaseoli var. fuscans]AT
MKNFMRSLGFGSSRSSRSSSSNWNEQQTDNDEQAPASSPSTSPSQTSSAFSGLPERPRKKAIALEESLNSSNNIPYEMRMYAEAALSAAKHGSSEAITKADVENKYYLAHAYNERFPELHLSCHDSAQSFFSEFMTSGKQAWRSIVRLSPSSLHHAAIDVRFKDGKRTMLVIEPALAYGMEGGEIKVMDGYETLGKNVQNCLGENGDMAVIQLGAQKSRFDCVIFSLNMALCAYQKDSVFDDLHDCLRRNVRCFSSGERKSILHENIEFIEGDKFLPPIFYKHSHSRGVVGEFISNQPEYAHKNVSTGRTNPNEDLSERVENFRVRRGDLSYSMSIEASRLRKIRKTIES